MSDLESLPTHLDLNFESLVAHQKADQLKVFNEVIFAG